MLMDWISKETIWILHPCFLFNSYVECAEMTHPYQSYELLVLLTSDRDIWKSSERMTCMSNWHGSLMTNTSDLHALRVIRPINL